MKCLLTLCFVLLKILSNSAGPIEDISTMPDLSLFYQQLIRQPDLQGLLQDAFVSQQTGFQGDLTIFAPNNDAMARINRRNEDPSILWKYHIVPGRFDDQTLYNMAQEKFNQVNPSRMTNVRAQNNLQTIATPFQVFYGIGFYGGVGPFIDLGIDTNNNNQGSSSSPWLSQTSMNHSNRFESSNRLNPYLVNMNNYNPNQQQTYVVAQGSSSSSNPNLFPQNLTNYYTNIFNPNVNTQFLQNAHAPNSQETNTNYQASQFFGPMNPNSVGILRPTINNAFILQTRPMSRGFINVIDNILWPAERRDQFQYKTALDALEDGQFTRLKLLAERSEYFRSELLSRNQQTWFFPTDQAFASYGSSINFLFDPSPNNTNDINDFIKSHVLPLVLYPSMMDASKQITTLSLGKWVTFRKTFQSDQSFQVDVILNRQVARILNSRPEEIRIYGNGLVYPISTILSGVARSAEDELARSYQYFMALIKQSGDTQLVNLLKGSTVGLGSSGPTINNPDNTLLITVLIPQQISVEQLGNSQDLSRNLRRHILRFPVYTDRFTSGTTISAEQPYPSYARSNKKSRRRRRRRQINIPPNGNFPNYGLGQNPQFQGNLPIQGYVPDIQNQPMVPPVQQDQMNSIATYPTSAVFQDGQIYPTMDPEFSVQAQIATGPNGNVVTLIGRPENSLPFTATILNTESNIPIKNGVMHVIRGILSGTVIPLDIVLTSIQGASSFTQLLQQTGVIQQLQQSGRPYTLFIPTNAALQSIGVTNNLNRIRQFVLRHICADVLMDPMANVLRRSAGFYNRAGSGRPRVKRQDWADAWRNGTMTLPGTPMRSPDLGPGYFQPQQQVYGGYPAAPSPYGFYNQLYNPSYVMSGYAAPNSQYYYGYNQSFSPSDLYYHQQMITANSPMTNAVWNHTLNAFQSPQVNVDPINTGSNGGQSYYTGTGGFFTGSTYVAGPQSCMAMTGERITVQPLSGTQPGAGSSKATLQNFVVTCCGDQSVNAMVQSFNVYPPSFAVYIIGRSILSQGQTINHLPNSSFYDQPNSYLFLLILLLSFIRFH